MWAEILVRVKKVKEVQDSIGYKCREHEEEYCVGMCLLNFRCIFVDGFPGKIKTFLGTLLHPRLCVNLNKLFRITCDNIRGGIISWCSSVSTLCIFLSCDYVCPTRRLLSTLSISRFVI